MSKRIFSKNDCNLDYNQYNKILSGTETLKTIKKEDNLAILKQFSNYKNWQTLTSAYFPFINNNEFETSYLKNIYQSNESFINKDCDVNNNCNNCKSNILYPYGRIITNKKVNPQFPTDIYLCNWCNNSKNVPKKSDIKVKLYECCCCKKKNNHCNLCKNARQLFI
jgi:hypothetical protein